MLKRVATVTPVYLLVAMLVLLTIKHHNAESALVVARAENKIAQLQAKNFSQPKPSLADVPARLAIPRLNLELTIAEGLYDIPTQSWTLSWDSAHFAAQTELANNRDDGGLTLIYGHNTEAVFGRTVELKTGDILEVTTVNGHQLTYRYQNDEVVLPTNTSIFEYTGPTRLTLMSCTGTWNEHRRLMNFELAAFEEAKA